MISAIKPLYRIFDWLENKVYRFLTVLGIGVFSLVVLSVIFQVFHRNIFIHFMSMSVSFTEEFARVGIVWVTYLFLPICLKEGRHATVNVLIDRVKGQARYWLFFLIQLISITFYAVTCVFSFKNLMINLHYSSPAMRLPGLWIFSSVTFGLLFASVQILIEVIGVLSGTLEPFHKIKPTDESDEIIGGVN